MPEDVEASARGATAEARAGIPPALEGLVARAAREVQILAALTPAAVAAERERLVGELRHRRRANPRWSYTPVDHSDLRRALDLAESALAPCEGPLHLLYLARVRELSLEAALCAAAGTKEVGGLARRRFAPVNAASAAAASELCEAWITEGAPAPAGYPILSDDPDPRSLLSQMRRAVGALRLPFAVVARPSLAALAATGDRFILVAAGRPVHDEDAARTVLHEVEGHACPRARAAGAAVTLVRAGTARGMDDQEGRALVLEERAGMLGARRRRQLAARHRAVEAMLDGASFADVAWSLADAHGFDAADAVLVAERAFRGGDGVQPGLGRERVYLESFVRVRARFAAYPEDEAVMASGQVAADAVDALRRCAL
ncbi:MAG TPA: tyrosine/phenylalanine carboxypeptidase domain-containing protein [Polyangiaceae bacterium]|jgi:hypothetical protein